MENKIKKIYNRIFQIDFLIKYGYYDVSIRKKNKIKDEEYLYEVSEGISDAFFSRIFNMTSVANFIKNMDNSSKEKLFNMNDDEQFNRYKATEPIYFSIPKNMSNRRLYKLPNLYSYLLLAFFINKNKDEFVKIFEENNFSTSKFFNFYRFLDTDELRQKLLYSGTKRLHLDLSNFYHTLYTHSIPWIINGKMEAKKNRTEGFSNNLDTLIRKCQYDETHGIPTGNLISKLVAELYMCYFDKKIENKGFKYSRYVDDICFSYSFESEEIEFLSLFRKICEEHNLIINENKTQIENFPFSNKNNKTKIFDYFNNADEKLTIEKWVDKIKNFIDYCISEEALGNKGAIKCIFAVLKQINPGINKINEVFSFYSQKTNFNIFEKILDVSLKDSRLTNKFIDLFETLKKKGFKKEKAERIINEYFNNNKTEYQKKIHHYFENGYNQELYQILLISIEFNSRALFNKDNLQKIISVKSDDFCLSLATILFYRIEKKLENLLPNIDELFIEINGRYTDQPVMAQQFWFYRYFIYSIIKKNNKILEEVKQYCKEKEYKLEKNKQYYESELFWEYRKKLGKNKWTEKIIDFYDELLKNKIELVCSNDF